MNATPPASDVEFLRHTVATLAYRAAKVLRDVPEGFATTKIAGDVRTPLELVGHLGDLIEWARRLADGSGSWAPASTGRWDADVERFFTALAALDAYLATKPTLAQPATTVFQAPIADALTHVGQLALLRRCAGAPIRPESYAKADIVSGRVGREQAPAGREFDGDASARRK
jgi:hypothetical protein